jgi:hypothetical protein
MYSVGPPMAMEYSCAQILSHDFIQELARELGFDPVRRYRHTADLNNGNVDISVDISTKCRYPPPTLSYRPYSEILWSRGLRGRRKRKRRGRKVGGVLLYFQQHACLPKINKTRPHVTSQERTLALALSRAT